MDGKVLAPIFEADWLGANPPRFTDQSIEGRIGTGVSREATEDVIERLKALGYIE
jgi:hypothetical protein